MLELSDHIGIGAVFGAILAVFRTLERLGERFLDGRRKNGNGNGKIVVVQLDPEVSRQIVETHGAVMGIEDIVTVRDENGAPMVYAPRAIMGRIENKLDKILQGK